MKRLSLLLASISVLISCGSGGGSSEDAKTDVTEKGEELTQEYVSTHLKQLVQEDVLVEGRKTYPLYLKKGTRLVIDYSCDGASAVNLYNADSRALLKTYKANVSDTLDVVNSAVYLFEINTQAPQYCDVHLQQKVCSAEEFTASYSIESEQVETTAGSFRAVEVLGIDMKTIFEEPHKYTIRSKMKYFLDTSSPYRTVASLKIPSGCTDLLYHLRISTDDDGKSSDGQFCNDVRTKYTEIKFLGLPLYESTTNKSSLFRELLNGLGVQREEKAYCNLFVFTSESQARKFQSNVALDKLSYNIDYSASGTQSRNERIPAKGYNTIYLGFENTRETHDIYIWVEALAAVPKKIYYTEKYKLAD